MAADKDWSQGHKKKKEKKENCYIIYWYSWFSIHVRLNFL